MNTVKTIIFSKNRAAQLDLLLRSIKIPATVLYTYDKDFDKGYKKVIKMYPKIKFLKQKDFKKDLLGLIKDSKYLLFLTDDDVFISPFSWNMPEFTKFINNPKVATLSLALSSKVVGVRWSWKTYRGNYKLRMWGYPMSVDSCVFRKEDIIDAIKANEIVNLNQLETQLNLNIPSRSLMMCLSCPVLINNSVNQVQTDFPAHTSGPSPETLEKIFLSGKRISLKAIQKKAKDARYYRIKVSYEYE